MSQPPDERDSAPSGRGLLSDRPRRPEPVDNPIDSRPARPAATGQSRREPGEDSVASDSISLTDAESMHQSVPTGFGGQAAATDRPTLQTEPRQSNVTGSDAAPGNHSGALPETDIRKVELPPVSALQVSHSGRRIQVRNAATTEKEDRSIIRGRLEIMRDDGAELTVYLDGPEITIGRARDMDIVALDDGISRSHAIFQRHENGFRLRDCGSGNGTYLNGKSIDLAELYDDDVITVGRLQLRYRTVGWTRPRRRKRSAVGLTLTETLAVETNRSPITSLLAGFCSAVVGFIIAALLSHTPENSGKRTPNYWYESAHASIQAKHWNDAAEELEIARVMGLQKGRYSKMAQTIQRAMVDERLLEQLTQGMESGLSWMQVQHLATRIDKTSIYWSQSQLMLEKIKRTFVERWSREAYRSYMSGNMKKLKRTLDQIQKADPKHATIKALARHIEN